MVGLWRYSETEAELRLRTHSSGPRSMSHFRGIKGSLQEPKVETQIYDPRERPWYKAGQTVNRHTWTSIHIDCKTLELVDTRA